MPKKSTNDNNVITIDINRLANIRVQLIVALATVILLGTSMLWWQKVNTTPGRVFEAMLRRNLTTASITKKVSSGSDGQKLDQYVQLSFAAEQPIARSLVVYEQKTQEGPNSLVKTETLGTNTADYSRYVQIETDQKNQQGKALDFSRVRDVWGKLDKNEDAAQVQNLQSAVFGLVPFARLDASLSDKFARQLIDSKAYGVDYSQAKSTTVNGRSVWQYTVKINVAEYLKVLQKVSQLVGVRDTSALNAEDYQNQPPVEVTMSVEKSSRQLLVLDTGSGGQKEEYSAYGITLPIQLPTNVVPQAELQQKLQDIR